MSCSFKRNNHSFCSNLPLLGLPVELPEQVLCDRRPELVLPEVFPHSRPEPLLPQQRPGHAHHRRALPVQDVVEKAQDLEQEFMIMK